MQKPAVKNGESPPQRAVVKTPTVDRVKIEKRPAVSLYLNELLA